VVVVAILNTTIARLVEQEQKTQAIATGYQQAQQQGQRDLDAMTQLRNIGQVCGDNQNDLAKCLNVIIEGAITFTGADKGNIQLFDQSSGALKIAAHRGFEKPFLEFFATVRDDPTACATAMHSGDRVIVEDVTQSAIFAGQLSLQ